MTPPLVEKPYYLIFTRASEKLFVTQPTISKMIRNMEEELGQPLL
ncbi:helix-turn-helix domain-containing protein, partial [Aeromonas caviae]